MKSIMSFWVRFQQYSSCRLHIIGWNSPGSFQKNDFGWSGNFLRSHFLLVLTYQKTASGNGTENVLFNYLLPLKISIEELMKEILFVKLKKPEFENQEKKSKLLAFWIIFLRELQFSGNQGKISLEHLSKSCELSIKTLIERMNPVWFRLPTLVWQLSDKIMNIDFELLVVQESQFQNWQKSKIMPSYAFFVTSWFW